MNTRDPKTVDQILTQIEDSYLLRGAPDADRRTLLDLMKQHTYARGDYLFHQDDPGKSLFILLSGKVRILIRDQANPSAEIPLRDFEPIRTLGELALLDGQKRSASAVAVEPTDVLELHRDDFLEFVQSRPLVGLLMMRDLVERVRYTTDYVQQVVQATTRLAEGGQIALDDTAQSKQDEEIGLLIQAFVNMVQNVKQREQALRNNPSVS